MRKLFVLFAIFMATQTTTLLAQNAEYRNTVTVGSAFNGWQVIRQTSKLFNVNDSIILNPKIRVTGTYNFMYDRGITNWFSLGLTGSYNQFTFKTERFHGQIDTFNYDGQINASIKRINIGLRPMVHYLNNGRLDLYSGLRLGIQVNRTKAGLDTNSNIPGEEFIKQLINLGALVGNNVRPTIQFVPFGLRGYITENLALGFETAIGPTYFLGAQLSYRF
jgi:hypothetical protein